eukprot:3569226-Pleurochrysis_carterae.AAC.2
MPHAPPSSASGAQWSDSRPRFEPPSPAALLSKPLRLAALAEWLGPADHRESLHAMSTDVLSGWLMQERELDFLYTCVLSSALTLLSSVSVIAFPLLNISRLCCDSQNVRCSSRYCRKPRPFGAGMFEKSDIAACSDFTTDATLSCDVHVRHFKALVHATEMTVLTNAARNND